MTGRILFACINGLHVDDAVAIAECLAVPVGYINVNTMTLHGDPPSITTHFSPLTLRQVRSGVLVPWLRSDDTVVLPQDVGILPQVLRASCRRKGCRVALMPDGVVRVTRADIGSAMKRCLRRTVYWLLRVSGIGSGQPGLMGSSRPDLVLGWGEGWRTALSSSSGAPFVAVGAARMDAMRAIPPTDSPTPRLLVCSQPIGILPGGGEGARRWYAFLEELREGLPSETQVRIRLHPAERHREDVPESFKAIPIRALGEDIAWATHVAAPFSTVLLESLVAGRIPIVLEDASVAEVLDSIPLFADLRVPRASWDLPALQAAMLRTGNWRDLAEDYATESESASRAVARYLELLHEGRSFR